MEFLPIQKTRNRKAKLMLYIDDYDRERLELQEPHDITVQEKIRQIVKAYLEGYEIGNDGDLEGL